MAVSKIMVLLAVAVLAIANVIMAAPGYHGGGGYGGGVALKVSQQSRSYVSTMSLWFKLSVIALLYNLSGAFVNSSLRREYKCPNVTDCQCFRGRYSSCPVAKCLANSSESTKWEYFQQLPNDTCQM
ncbi:hypothetical protein CHUAL_006930 [Chamberlinius hualienensis]